MIWRNPLDDIVPLYIYIHSVLQAGVGCSRGRLFRHPAKKWCGILVSLENILSASKGPPMKNVCKWACSIFLWYRVMPSNLPSGNGTEGAVVCTDLGRQLRPQFYFLWVSLMVSLCTMILSPFEFTRRFQNPGRAEPAICVYELWIQSSFLMR